MKAKLKLIHEVVVRNRLELLRRKQRDEAVQAQHQLMAAVKSNILRDPEVEKTGRTENEHVLYLANMSPKLLSSSDVSQDDLELNILTEADLQQELVRTLVNFASNPAVSETLCR